MYSNLNQHLGSYDTRFILFKAERGQGTFSGLHSCRGANALSCPPTSSHESAVKPLPTGLPFYFGDPLRALK